MYLYNKSMIDNFKFPFKGIKSIEQNFSQSLQDMFVLSVLDGKQNGTFLEIGASTPINISNTYLLEKYFSWSGVSIDIDPSTKSMFEDVKRTARVIIGDAVELDYNIILAGFDSNVLDYISLDIEPNTNTLACLKNLPLDNFDFRVASYETDYYDPANSEENNYAVREESRNILQSHGYILVNGNVENMGNDPFEDWYINGKYFNKSVIDKFMREDDTPLMARHYMLRNVE